MNLDYQKYHQRLSKHLQEEDDYAWLEFMERDPRVPPEDIEKTRKDIMMKWGEIPERKH